MKKNIIILTVVSILGLSSLEAMQPKPHKIPFGKIQLWGGQPKPSSMKSCMSNFPVNPEDAEGSGTEPIKFKNCMSKFKIEKTNNEPSSNIIRERYTCCPNIQAQIDFQNEQNMTTSIFQIYTHLLHAHLKIKLPTNRVEIESYKTSVVNTLVDYGFKILPTLRQNLGKYFREIDWDPNLRVEFLGNIAHDAVTKFFAQQTNPIIQVNGNITINNINNPITINNNVNQPNQPSTQVQQQDQRIKRLDKISITNLLNPQ